MFSQGKKERETRQKKHERHQKKGLPEQKFKTALETRAHEPRFPESRQREKQSQRE